MKKIHWIFIGTGIFILFGILGALQGESTQNTQNNTKNAPQHLAAKKTTLRDIAHKPSDIPPPIRRNENKTVVINLEATEQTAEIMPGITYTYWTFNNTVPGPFIRVMEGDTVEVNLSHSHEGGSHAKQDDEHSFATGSLFITEARAEEAHIHDDGSAHMHDSHAHDDSHAHAGHGEHSVDLHAVLGPGGGAVVQVKPDENKTFRFKATRPGIYIYHCASKHVPTHISNGMYGMILVEPRGGLSPVDKEFYVMQGELYTTHEYGREGHQELDTKKLKYINPEYVVFNGRVGGVAGNNALTARVGEKIRIFFGVGTFIPSNFHIIGGILDKLYLEGDIISPPHRNIQTTLVPAGGAIMTEFTAEVPGTFMLVDHALPRAVDMGALGELIVTGNSRPEIFEVVE